MKRIKSPVLTAAVAVTVALLSPSAAQAGHDRQMQNQLQTWHDFGNHRQFHNRSGHGSNIQNNVFQSSNINRSAANFNRVIDTANSINLINQIRANHNHGNRFNRQLRFSAIEAGSLPSDLNLASRKETYVAPSFNGTVTITQGGQQVLVNSSSSLTAAEAVAVHQVLYAGGQSIVLGRKGDADGGSMSLDSDLSQNLSSLRIPKGVTVTSDFGTRQTLSIAGDIINSGQFLAISSNPSVSSAVVSADNIRNRATGVLSSTSSANPLDLNLLAHHQIVNNGRIESSGNLNLKAGDAIYNTFETANSTSTPVISAAGNISLDSKTIVNDGIVSATTGNIYLANTVGQDAIANTQPTNIAISSNNGVFRADKGDIVVGNNSLTASDTITMYGGNYYSNNLLVNAGAGTANGTIFDVTGQLKVNAGEAHLGVSTANLLLGQCDIAGDPTFFNNAGSITITGNLAFDEAISILASQDVTDGGTAYQISSRNIGSPGHDITIVAGGNLTALGGAQPNPIANNNQITQGQVSLSGGSTTGGNVDLKMSTILSNGTTGGAGAKTTILAFAAKDGSAGQVKVNSIFTGGSGAADNGDITIIAGSNKTGVGSAIEVDDFSTVGGGGKLGNIFLTNAQPTASLTFDTQGVASGSIGNSKKFAIGGTSTNIIATGGGAVVVNTAGGAQIGSSGGITDLAGSQSGSNAGSITVTAGNINVTGNIDATGQSGISSGLPACRAAMVEMAERFHLPLPEPRWVESL